MCIEVGRSSINISKSLISCERMSRPSPLRRVNFCPSKGPSIKYVTLFFANVDPHPPVTLCHTSRDPPKVRHTYRTPRFLVSPVCKFCLNCSRGFLSGGFVFCLEGFVLVGFCPFPFCQNTSVTTES